MQHYSQRIPLLNLTATTAPDEFQDELEGYSVGSLWLYLGYLYKCFNSTPANAIWKLLNDTTDSLYMATATVDGINGDNSNGRLNDPKRPYRDIVVAMDALKLAITTSISFPVQGRAFCNVKKGTYYENHINREHIDMNFEYGAVVISDENVKAIFTDVSGNNEPLNIKVTGKGQFYHTVYAPNGYDNQAIAVNNSLTTNFEFEAYEIDGIQLYGGGGTENIKITVKNTRIRFTVILTGQKTINCENCVFLSGLALAHHSHYGSVADYNNCEFIVPADNLDSLVEIRSHSGALLETIDYESDNQPYIFGSGTREQIENLHTDADNHPIIAGVYFSQRGSASENYRVSIRNSKIRIQKSGCIGIAIIQKREVDFSTLKDSFLMFSDIHIEDETSGKNATGVLAKKVDSLSTTIPYMFSAITSNCEVLIGSGFEAGYIAIEPSYDFIPLISSNSSSITESIVAGENVATGDLVYLKSDGKWWKTDYTIEATLQTELRIVSDTTILANATGLAYKPNAEITLTGLTVGVPYYVGIAGAITTTIPDVDDIFQRYVGTAKSSTILEFFPDSNYYELGSGSVGAGVGLETFFESLTIVSNQVTIDCQNKAFPIFFINDLGTAPLQILKANDYGVVEVTIIIECTAFPLGLITLPITSYPATYLPLNLSGRIVMKGSWSFGDFQWTIDETNPIYNDIPKTGASDISGNLESNQSYFQIGLNTSSNTIQFSDEVYTNLFSNNPTTQITSLVQTRSDGQGSLNISVTNPVTLAGREFRIVGTTSTTPDQSFLFNRGLAYYAGDYTAQMVNDRTLPDIGRVNQLISSGAGVLSFNGRVGAVVSQPADYAIGDITDGQSTFLPNGKIWIGDGTNTAFPRDFSGDVIINNTGVTTYNAIVPSTKGGAGSINGILKSNGSGVVSLAVSGTDYVVPGALSGYLPIIGGNLTGTTGNGYIGYLAQSSSPTPYIFGTNGFKSYASSTGNPTIIERIGNNIFTTTQNELKNTIGDLVNDNFDRATLGYTVIGANGSFAISGNILNVVNTTGNTTYNHYALIGYTTMLESYTYEAEFIGISNGNGVGLGWVDTYDVGYSCKLDMNTSGNRGVLTISRVVSGTGTVILTAPAITYTNNTDILHLKISIVGYRLIAQVWKNNDNPTTLTYDYPFNVSCFKRFNKLIINSFGGSQNFSNIKVHSNTVKNKKISWVGDSNSLGANITSGFNYEMASFILRNKFGGNFSQYSGSGATLVDFYNNIEEFVKLNNEIVIISLGSNDAVKGISSATYISTLDLILARLKLANITVILTTVSPNTTYNAAITLYNTYINSLSVNYEIIDLYTLLSTGTALKTIYDTGDGLHWNQSGQIAVANLIINDTSYLWENFPTLHTGKIILDGFKISNSLYISSNEPVNGINVRIGSVDKTTIAQSVINFEALGTTGSTDRLALVAGYVAGSDNFQLTQFITGSGVYKDFKFGVGLNSNDFVIKSTSLIGIGTPNPASKLHVEAPFANSSREEIVRFGVSDVSTDFGLLYNATVTDAAFSSGIAGIRNSSNGTPMFITGYTTSANDNGSNALVRIYCATTSSSTNPANGTLSSVTTRPLFDILNANSSILTVLANGNIGIGTTSPAVKLHIQTSSITSIREETIRFSVSDASTDFGMLNNATSINNEFGTGLSGIRNSSNGTPLFIGGYTTSANDNGTNPLVRIFCASTNSSTDPINGTLSAVTRPLFDIVNASVSVVTVLANGNLGIGSTSPSNARLHIRSTTEQQRTEYDASNYMTTTVSSTGTTTYDLAGTSPTFIFSKSLFVNSVFATNTTITSANFGVGASNGLNNTTNANVLLLTASSMNYRVIERGSGTGTPAANSSLANHILGTSVITIAGSGTHDIFAQFAIKPLSISTGAGSLTNSASLYIENAATNATNNYSIWVDSGITRLDGNVAIGTTTLPSEALEIGGNTKLNHIIGRTSAPSIASGAGAGTTPTLSVTNATDISGIVNVTTGTLPTGTNAVIATITFNVAYTQAPNITLTPANALTAALSASATMVYCTSTTTTFVINAGTTGLTATTAYSWFYLVIQ